ncbi:hypothetical protein [Caballeronia sp. GaOx3]|uniref:hypothetical protein n=1 Tax=Caballeronia sp. GaOx3 TaxID=2921740 RepID=UPI0020297515|nr:hypothetical protein [Caballeronia sp. GaOx3]
MRSDFLRDLLTKKPYSDFIFEHPFAFTRFDAEGVLGLVTVKLPGSIYFEDFSFKDGIVFDHVTLEGTLNFYGGKISNAVLLSSHFIGGVLVQNTLFGRDLDVMRCPKDDTLISLMGDGSKFEGEVVIEKSTLGRVSIRNADFNGFGFEGSVAKSLDFTSSKFSKVFVIEDQSTVGDSTPESFDSAGLNLDSAQVKADVLLSGNFPKSIFMNSATIDGSLVLSDGSFWSIFANNLHVSGQFVLGAGRMNPTDSSAKHWPGWQPNSTIILSNSRINQIYSPQNLKAWPSHLVLRDLSFDSVLHEGGPADSSAQSERAWFSQWLARADERPYSPQPYQQVVSFLQKSGYADDAADVGVAGKRLELREVCSAWNVSKCLYLWGSFVFIGFGYKIYWSVYWSAFFAAFGWLIFATDRHAVVTTTPWKPVRLGFLYSIDMLLPVLKLREDSTKVQVSTGWRTGYLYLHKTMGWLLGSFLVAGLSGITK